MGYTRTYPSRGYTAPDYKGTLHLCSMDTYPRGCGYWWTVTDNSTAHTAFRTLESLHAWLKQTGLELTQDLPPKGTHGCQALKGSYRTEMHGDYESFYRLAGKHSRELSNGEYTLAITTTDADGIRTVHTLNPNCRERPVFDYRESAAMQDRGDDWDANSLRRLESWVMADPR